MKQRTEDNRIGEKKFMIQSRDFMLYHGTGNYFSKISLDKARDFKDFGKGFYLTTVREQAIDWAEKRAGKRDRAYVYAYSLKGATIKEDFRILEHLRYTEEWLDLVTECRTNAYEPEYDIIYDRMADGDTDSIVRNYKAGKISATWALNDIRKWRGAHDQYCFKSEKAIRLLDRIEEVVLLRENDEWRKS